MSNNKEPFPHQMPPPLDECIQTFEADLHSSPNKQITIDRVFVLGAGFSCDFGFTTSAKIVKGVMDFIEKNCPNKWFERNFRNVERFLDSEFPNWRNSSPDLIEVSNRFFPEQSRCANTFIDPLNLHSQNSSWENENYSVKAPAHNYEYAMLSFEALLCIYLFAGLSMKQVFLSWAEEFIDRLTEKDVILTFNWDVIPEALLTQIGKPFSRYEWRQGYVKVTKLHGSIDLIGVPNEKMHRHVQDNPRALERLTPMLWRTVTSEDFFPRTRPFPFGRELFPWEWYNKSAVLIMPPFYTYGYGYKLIQFNWRKARVALERAKQVCIIGYSLSESDRPFCSLLKSVADTWSDKIRVQVWNLDAQAAERAKLLCGSNRVDFYQRKASEVEL
jgi:hypothetical protein